MGSGVGGYRVIGRRCHYSQVGTLSMSTGSVSDRQGTGGVKVQSVVSVSQVRVCVNRQQQ